MIYVSIYNSIKETLKNQKNSHQQSLRFSSFFQVRNACDDLQGPVHNFDPPGRDDRHGNSCWTLIGLLKIFHGSVEKKVSEVLSCVWVAVQKWGIPAYPIF